MLTSCGANGNGTAFCNLTSSPQVTITMTGAQGKAAVRNADGSLPAIHVVAALTRPRPALSSAR